jgi:hypothetical protein
MKKSDIWFIFSIVCLVLAALKILDYLPFYALAIITNIWRAKEE